MPNFSLNLFSAVLIDTFTFSEISLLLKNLSGGGVSFTGGEATLWADELLCALKGLRAKGIHTCIETNGTSALLTKI